MTKSKNRKRKNGVASLPAGVKVVPAPKSATYRKLISGADITTSGGCRTVHTSSVNSR